jgi:hypothetical protein
MSIRKIPVELDVSAFIWVNRIKYEMNCSRGEAIDIVMEWFLAMTNKEFIEIAYSVDRRNR